ncbi:outer membrane beta-barrel protein [Pontibacter virosus]|uniref:Outer membrane protein with beta-barrel domain n=1 Tax=Pontibacter virosus TaxID=1765052 RepID=A0A2U1B2V0_9BACT|nr:outer membrane beta-barrel protein [Pontibacter virosus]PVY42857.1 outer membrane protein with beta-barrel domain [Pontibacter virosus]
MFHPLYRHLLVIALLVCFSAAAQAQRVHRFGLQVGAASPIGDFKKDRFEDDYPPMARRGVNVQGTYRVDVKPYLAVGASAGFRFHRFDMDAFAAPDDALALRREATGWKSTHTLADLYLQTPPGTLFGYVKGSLGGAHNQSPEVQVDTPYGPIRRSSDTALALAYGIASGFAIQDGRFLLSLDIGLLATQPAFEVTNAQGVRSTLKQPMHTINSTLGLSYTL